LTTRRPVRARPAKSQRLIRTIRSELRLTGHPGRQTLGVIAARSRAVSGEMLERKAGASAPRAIGAMASAAITAQQMWRTDINRV
jgi:hypothetical protein